MKYKIAFVGNSSLTMHNFRINLLRSMVKLGYEVVVLAPKDSDTTSYKSNRIRYIPIDVDCKGVNPVKDFALMKKLADQRRLDRHDVTGASDDALSLLSQWCEDGWAHAVPQ